MFDFSVWFPSQQANVETVLRQRLLANRQTPGPLLEAMQYSLLGGGKRLRPVLCLAFASATERNSTPVLAEDAAYALESVHTYSLIHDDLPAMDNDDLRRGQPTSHKKFGEAMAILAGDALLTDAFSTLAKAQHSAETASRLELVRLLACASGSFGMVGGQVLDIDPNRPAEVEYLKKLHRMKTGVLIEAACVMGAVAGGASVKQMEEAAAYGSRLGLAFQIADDILDVTQTSAVMGKPTGADAASGRHTFPAVLGLDASAALARQLVDEAMAVATRLESTPGPLTGLAQYCVSRTK
jgi:geranylgeranyl diphosphate synthase, type II